MYLELRTGDEIDYEVSVRDNWRPYQGKVLQATDKHVTVMLTNHRYKASILLADLESRKVRLKRVNGKEVDVMAIPKPQRVELEKIWGDNFHDIRKVAKALDVSVTTARNWLIQDGLYQPETKKTDPATQQGQDPGPKQEGDNPTDPAGEQQDDGGKTPSETLKEILKLVNRTDRMANQLNDLEGKVGEIPDLINEAVETRAGMLLEQMNGVDEAVLQRIIEAILKPIVERVDDMDKLLTEIDKTQTAMEDEMDEVDERLAALEKKEPGEGTSACDCPVREIPRAQLVDLLADVLVAALAKVEGGSVQ
jgi:hypothetical protein